MRYTNRQVAVAAMAAATWAMTAGSAVAQETATADLRMEPATFSAEIVRQVDLDYLQYLPPDYDDQDAWPLVLFLHGAGERGDELSKVAVHGPPKLVAAGRDFPFVLISPQCPTGERWDAESLALLVKDAKNRLKIDPDRVYCTGLSMGGFGTWSLAGSYPDLFAAIAPICGGGEPRSARRFAKQLPAWVFHGAKDETVALEESQEMVDAMHRYGEGEEEVRFTIYPEAGHDSWTESYDNEELYDWLLAHRRKS